MKELVIDGNVWMRGHISRLRDERGNMCVLGFCGLAVGIPEHCLEMCASIATLANRYPKEARKMPEGVDEAVAPNDDPTIDDAERCDEILGIFARAGIVVVFTNVPGVSP